MKVKNLYINFLWNHSFVKNIIFPEDRLICGNDFRIMWWKRIVESSVIILFTFMFCFVCKKEKKRKYGSPIYVHELRIFNLVDLTQCFSPYFTWNTVKSLKENNELYLFCVSLLFKVAPFFFFFMFKKLITVVKTWFLSW